GAEVTRIEAPERRDGLTRTAAGRGAWARFNAAKRLVMADARRPDGRPTIGEAIATADVLVTRPTPPLLPQPRFDAALFANHAPRLLRLELVAYEPPYAHLPGLGEQAAALAGLLGEATAPRPWADPLLGAWALLVIQAWRSGAAGPAVVRLSLEAAAARVHV